jgi:hypothetical protein
MCPYDPIQTEIHAAGVRGAPGDMAFSRFRWIRYLHPAYSLFYTASQPTPGDACLSPYYWLPYTWDYKDLRGTYLLRVTCPTSKAFKEAVYEEKIELK